LSPIRRNTFWTQDGDLIQPSGIFELDDGDFFKVVHLDYHEISSRSRVPTAWGWRFRKTSKTLGLPTENPNDVYLILYKNNFDGLEKISVPQILHQTKISFASPVTSEHSNQEQWDSAHDSDTSDNLICRWIHVFATKSAFLGKMKSGKKTNPPKDAFEPSASHIEYFKFIPWGSEDADIAITKLEASDEFESMAQIYAPNAIPHLEKRLGESRTNTELCQAMEKLSLADSKVHHEAEGSPLENQPTGNVGALYEIMDVFCGCGAVSKAAEKAGLKVIGGLDHDSAACESYRLNFPLFQGVFSPVISVVRP